MKIDSHQHFWKYNQTKHSWMDGSMQDIQKDFMPADLEPLLQKNTIDGCIAVQADQSEKETEFLLSIAWDNYFIKGVIGWVDLMSENVDERLAHYSKNPYFKGVRHIVQAESEGFMLREDFQRGLSKMEKFNLVYEILIMPNQLEEAIALVSKFPKQSFVLNHLAKPYIKDKKIEPWANHIKQLAQHKNVSCKISGMVTETNWTNWQESDFKPYIDVVVENFGTKRLMFGSDWPVCLLAGKYEYVLQIVSNYFSNFSNKDKELVFGINAARIYNL